MVFGVEHDALSILEVLIAAKRKGLTLEHNSKVTYLRSCRAPPKFQFLASFAQLHFMALLSRWGIFLPLIPALAAAVIFLVAAECS